MIYILVYTRIQLLDQNLFFCWFAKNFIVKTQKGLFSFLKTNLFLSEHLFFLEDFSCQC